MGLFDKIKNILFEDEEDTKEMPIYNKDSIKREEPKVRKEVKQTPKNENKAPVPIRVHIPDTEENIKEPSRFRDIKKEIDIEAIATKENFPSTRMSQYETREIPTLETPAPPQRSVFQSFDEEEFERINSPKPVEEVRPKKEVDTTRRPKPHSENIDQPSKQAKNDSYGSSHGRKPFRPSPVISPVYGILDKNYSKDDIVDKKNVIKREKPNPVIYTPEIRRDNFRTEEENNEKDFDIIRKKAYGGIEMENIPPRIEEEPEEIRTLESVRDEAYDDVKVYEEPNNDVIDNSSLDEIVDNHFNNNVRQEIIESDDEEEYEEPELPKIPEPEEEKEPDFEEEIEEHVEEIKYPKALDDIEKTSTLQILDDIEKELNAIKPSSKKYAYSEDEEESEQEDSLENDLFNLIDSMYEKGEEENND